MRVALIILALMAGVISGVGLGAQDGTEQQRHNRALGAITILLVAIVLAAIGLSL